MSTLIEIACFLVKEETVQAIVEEYCQETGDRLIGRSVYEETDEVLLVLQFLHLGNVNKIAAVLSHAFPLGLSLIQL